MATATTTTTAINSNMLTQWFDLYTHRRPHGLGGRTPFEVYHGLQLN